MFGKSYNGKDSTNFAKAMTDVFQNIRARSVALVYKNQGQNS